MTTLVMLNGAIETPERALVSVFDRGFLFGDSVFEVLRTYGGRPCAHGRHLARLERSAARVFIPLPISTAELGSEIRATLEAAGNPESYVRVMLTRGVGQTIGLDPALAAAPTRVVMVSALHALPPEIYEQGVSVITYRTQRVADATEAAGAKIGNYLTAVLATREARARGAHEALVLDAQGLVVEGSTSNVFSLRNGALVTPPESAGILLGITRGFVLEAARELGLDVSERPLSVQELALSDEVFISSSIRELVPVVNVDGVAVATGKPGPLTLELLRVFREKIIHSE
jgi:branched-chain amino acid aminotransferase